MCLACVKDFEIDEADDVQSEKTPTKCASKTSKRKMKDPDTLEEFAQRLSQDVACNDSKPTA